MLQGKKSAVNQLWIFFLVLWCGNQDPHLITATFYWTATKNPTKELKFYNLINRAIIISC